MQQKQLNTLMIQWNKSPSGKPSYFGSSLVLLALGASWTNRCDASGTG